MHRAGKHWDDRLSRRLRLRDLRYLIAISELGSMAKAAASLGVSQPAVSKAVGDLEDALGASLLERSPRGVMPTIYGQALIRRGLAVFDELKLGIGEIEYLADPTAGEVRIGCGEAGAAGYLAPVVERFTRQNPRVVLHVGPINRRHPRLPRTTRAQTRSHDRANSDSVCGRYLEC